VRRRQAGAASERLESAVACFNASDGGRTVAGLARSLGSPRVSVGAAAGSSSQARITVAWDLCWYQWSVDASSGTVAEVARGTEVQQLDRAARHWNALLGPGARIAFGAVAASPRRRWLRRR